MHTQSKWASYQPSMLYHTSLPSKPRWRKWNTPFTSLERKVSGHVMLCDVMQAHQPLVFVIHILLHIFCSFPHPYTPSVPIPFHPSIFLTSFYFPLTVPSVLLLSLTSHILPLFLSPYPPLPLSLFLPLSLPLSLLLSPSLSHFLPLTLSSSDLGFRYDWTTVCTVVDVASTGPATQILAPGDHIIKVK